MTPFTFKHQGTPERLDKLVVAHAQSEPPISRSQIERWIESGCVSVGGRVISKPAFKVDEGLEVVVTPPALEPSPLIPLDFKLDILFEDAHLIVVNKPAGLSMHPGAGNPSVTLANAIVAHVGSGQAGVGEPDRPGIVHRLDKDTTGVVIIAKSTPVHAALARQFAERSVGRSYRALVFTTPRASRTVQKSDSGEVCAPIGRHPTNRKKMCVSEQGRQSTTMWRVLERFAYGTLIECTLKTGRTHQIRVHMESIDCPVIGDPMYGDFANLPRPLQEASSTFGRQALHAATLALSHPVTGERLSFSAKDPDDLAALLEAFRSQA
jgi:23S rRNA pseudouridine1911/1915/1917 synthase